MQGAVGQFELGGGRACRQFKEGGWLREAGMLVDRTDNSTQQVAGAKAAKVFVFSFYFGLGRDFEERD